MQDQKVSIITPCFNCSLFFKDTFDAVINQTYKNFEWIIVDDCSTDDSFILISNLIKQYQNIKLLHLQINSGSSKARNIALEHATGKYITFLDADDLIDSNYLEEQVKFIRTNGPIITAGYRRYSNGRYSSFVPRPKIDYKGLLVGNDCSCLTTMYDKDIIGDIKFLENISKQEDFVFWLNILKKGYIVNTNAQILATYRIHSNSKNKNKIPLIKYQYIVYHKVLGLNFISTLYYLLRWGIYGLKKYKDVN